jgi:hypothetical protein
VSEEKKPTETEIIGTTIVSMREVLRAPGALTSVEVNALFHLINDIEKANEARDKSRKLSIDVTAYDFTEPMVRALLSQGFDVAIAAVVPQLKTVVKSGNVMAWVPPENPFQRSAAPTSEPPKAAEPA